MRACLEAGGYRVHAYTSPHLVRFHERIRLAGRLIEEEALIALLEECERANGGTPITFFEITTAAAFLAFAREPADIVLLETGLGGRLDATNVIRRPAVTAITPISLDHQAFLGDTIDKIAGEKAGIIKAWRAGGRRAAAGRGGNGHRERAPMSWARRFFGGGTNGVANGIGTGMRFSGGRWQFDLPLPSLLGAHQIVNAGTAIACLERLRDFPLLARSDRPGIAAYRMAGAAAAADAAVRWSRRCRQAGSSGSTAGTIPGPA